MQIFFKKKGVNYETVPILQKNAPQNLHNTNYMHKFAAQLIKTRK